MATPMSLMPVALTAKSSSEILKNPVGLRENAPVIADVDWDHGCQAVRFR